MKKQKNIKQPTRSIKRRKPIKLMSKGKSIAMMVVCGLIIAAAIAILVYMGMNGQIELT